MKNETIEKIIELTSLLGFIQGQCKVLISHSEINWKVLGKDSFSSDFRQVLKILNILPHDDEILYVKEQVKNRLSYFNENYDKRRLRAWKKSFSLTKEDRDDLFDEIEEWHNVLLDYVLKPHFETIKETTFEKMFPINLTNGLSLSVKVDLMDGFNLLGSRSPTAAAMILVLLVPLSHLLLFPTRVTDSVMLPSLGIEYEILEMNIPEHSTSTSALAPP